MIDDLAAEIDDMNATEARPVDEPIATVAAPAAAAAEAASEGSAKPIATAVTAAIEYAFFSESSFLLGSSVKPLSSDFGWAGELSSESEACPRLVK